MNFSFIKSIEYSKNFINNLINETTKKININEEIIEDAFMFSKPVNSLIKRSNEYTNRIFLLKLFLKEIDKIKVFEKASRHDIKEILSPYGSFYYGTDTFYYNDDIISYSDHQFMQILINHILHYLLGRYTYANIGNCTDVKSEILYLFLYSGLSDVKIIHNRSSRQTLYNNPQYKKIIKELIIFKPHDYYMEFFIQNCYKFDYFIKYVYNANNYIMGITLYSNQTSIEFRYYNYMFSINKLFVQKSSSALTGISNNFHPAMKSGVSYEFSELIRKKYNNLKNNIKEVYTNVKIYSKFN